MDRLPASGPSVGGDPRRRRPPVWPAAAGIGLLLLLVAYLVSRWPSLLATVELQPRWLLAAGAGEVALTLLRAALLRVLCQPFGAELRWPETMGLLGWGGLANYVAPAVGSVGLRAAYLRQRHHLDAAMLANILTATYVLQFSVLSMLGLAAASFAQLETELRRQLLLAFGGLFVVCAALLWTPPGRVRAAGRFGGFLRRLLAGRARLRGVPLGSLMALLGLYALSSWGTFFSYFALLGHPPSPAGGALIAVCSELSSALAITPASLGINESAVALAARAVEIPLPVAIAAAALRRGVTLLVLLGVAAATLRGFARPSWRGVEEEGGER